ncbi:MAG: hypothetical protein ACFFED_16385, partial [Candidatus Thorarchaeota archaeon]
QDRHNICEVYLLRNKAVEEGYAAEGYLKMARQIATNGRVAPKTHAVDKMRERLGLPELQAPSLEEVHKIFEASGFNRILEKYARKEAEE